MKKIRKILTTDNIGAGYLYFYIHFVTEVLCFYLLASLIGDSPFLWLCPFIYDTVAFVPQSIIGYLNDKYPKLNIGIIGILLLVFGFVSFFLPIISSKYISIIILCLGNAFIHVRGAEVTLRVSGGKLSHSAIFVSGGSFGVITGKLLRSAGISYIFLAVWALTMIPCAILADCYLDDCGDTSCSKFNYHSNKVPLGITVLLAVLVVAVRGYMGYGIPTTWNKTILQTVALYFAMGFGKALGGILSDAFGMRRIALCSTILAIPFLIIGDKHMLVSLIGVLLFSMTMAITLGILVSVLKGTPGLGFGLTTIGLYLGTIPVFFYRFDSFFQNSIIIFAFSTLCVTILLYIIRKDDKNAKS